MVCTANLCRSPMAAALIAARLGAESSGPQLTVTSAGVAARPGQPAAELAVEALRRRGIDLSGHRSRGVSADLLREADLVLVMEEAHRRSLFYEDPSVLPRVFLLTEMSGGHEEVADPWGGSGADYESCLATLVDLVDRGWDAIIARAGGRDRE